MNIENPNSPVYKYRLFDFARSQGSEVTTDFAFLTKMEAQQKNFAFAVNGTQKKYLKEQ